MLSKRATRTERLRAAVGVLRKIPPPSKRDVYVHAGLVLLMGGISLMYLPLGITVGGAFLAYLGLRK